jgi:hypothetical protein
VIGGLKLEDARGISARYPDFLMCKSEGKFEAIELVEHLSFVPADRNTLSTLEKLIREHKRSVKEGGDRVWIRISGSKLTLHKAIFREKNENITHVYGEQDFRLILSAEIVEGKPLLQGP